MTTDSEIDPRCENGNGEDCPECPLCMEVLDLDDISFYPCTCGYQVCKFCWHRIKTDDSGLCPACRQKYPDDPVEFKPVPTEEMQKFKTSKKQRIVQKKKDVKEKGDRIIDSRKHLATIRVVQKNLVFVIGLSPKLTDSDILKKPEYFGRFGKIQKVMVNTLNANGTLASSASAYITYVRSDDALRAVQALNGFHVDGRILKVSLGTTKYCVNFLKNQSCVKAECMYLHDLGDGQASFTKEDMQAGKHQEYEKRLLDTVAPAVGSTSAPVDISSRSVKLSLSGSSENVSLATSDCAKNASTPSSLPREPSPASSSISSSSSGSLNEQPSERASPNVPFDLFVDTFEEFGFDPWNESSKGLAALMELETRSREPQIVNGFSAPFGSNPFQQAFERINGFPTQTYDRPAPVSSHSYPYRDDGMMFNANNNAMYLQQQQQIQHQQQQQQRRPRNEFDLSGNEFIMPGQKWTDMRLVEPVQPSYGQYHRGLSSHNGTSGGSYQPQSGTDFINMNAGLGGSFNFRTSRLNVQ